MTASLYRKYNTFSDRESEQQHRTMTFAELPNHLLLTYVPTFFHAKINGCMAFDPCSLYSINNGTVEFVNIKDLHHIHERTMSAFKHFFFHFYCTKPNFNELVLDLWPTLALTSRKIGPILFEISW